MEGATPAGERVLIGGGLSAARSVSGLPPQGRQGRHGIKGRAFIAMLALAAGATPALCDPKLDMAVMMTQATLLAQRCGKGTVDQFVAESALSRQGLTWTDISQGGPYWDAVQVAAVNAKQDMARYSAETACNAARKLFGSDGEAVPGLIVGG